MAALVLLSIPSYNIESNVREKVLQSQYRRGWVVGAVYKNNSNDHNITFTPCTHYYIMHHVYGGGTLALYI